MLRKFNFLITTLLFLSAPARAYNVLVNPPNPYPQQVMGDPNGPIYFAGNNSGVPSGGSGNVNTGLGYQFIKTLDSGTAGLIYLDVSTNASLTPGTNETIAVSVMPVSGTTEVTLFGAEEMGTSDPGTPTPCTANGNCVANSAGAYYKPGTILRLAFTVNSLCAASAGTGLCSGLTPQNTTAAMLVQAIQVNFGVVTTSPINGDAITTAAASGGTRGAKSMNINIAITDQNPTTACPTNTADSSFYFPGDGQIYFYGSNIVSGVNGGAPLQSLVTMFKDGGAATDFGSGAGSNSIVHYTPNGTSSEEITGFTNTTTGSDHRYQAIVQSQSSAGLVAPLASSCVPSFTIQSQNITGILKESKCFIATAAYHDGRAAPVMMLREFRDHILAKFSLGQDFIRTYYHYSPALAEWAWDKPLIRAAALKLLAPVELMAWAVLKISAAQEVAPSENPQPYIDRLKKDLPPEVDPSTMSYSEQEKKKLLENEKTSAEANQPYIDRLKKQIADEEKGTPVEGYSERERAKLPPDTDRESPIKMVKEGRDQKPGMGELPEIHNAAGVKFGITPGVGVTVANGAHSFDEVYGSGFQPELIFHYERQFFHSENFGSLGLGVDFGVAYSGGNGLLQFGFGSAGNRSQTGFSFYQIPTILSGVYRFNLLRVIRPYVSAGAGSIAYTETRSDAKPDKRGITAVYSGSLGASVLLDFLDPSGHRDSYLSTGIQHTYLFIEYLYLASFKSNVTFKRSGIYSGFTFEF